MRAAFILRYAGIFMLVLTGCKDQAEEYRRMALENTFRSIGEEMSGHGADAFRSLENKWFDYSRRTKTEPWLERAKQVITAANEAFAYLDSLEGRLHKNEITSGTLFGEGILYDRMLGYKHQMLSTFYPAQFLDFSVVFSNQMTKDSLSFLVYSELLPEDTSMNASSRKNQWIANHSSGLSKQSMLLFITKFKADVLALQAQVIEYMGNQIGVVDRWFIAAPQCDISSLQIKKGQRLTVFLGYGYLNYQSSERIYIQDSITSSESWDWASRKIKVAGPPGKYSIPVRFEYEENGLIKKATRQLEYEIVP